MQKTNKILLIVLSIVIIAFIAGKLIINNLYSSNQAVFYNTFLTEIQSIYSNAEVQFISDTMRYDREEMPSGFAYGRSNGSACIGYSLNGYNDVPGDVNYYNLDLSGTNKIDYYIEFNRAGYVIKYYATDGEYQFAYYGDGLKKYDIDWADIEKHRDLKIDYIWYNKNVNSDNKNDYLIKIEEPKSEPNYYKYNTYASVINLKEAEKYCNKSDSNCKYQKLIIKPNTCEIVSE